MTRRWSLLLATGALVLAAFAPESARAALTSAPQPSFAAPRTTTVGIGVTDPRTVAATDFDGDGRVDLVVASRNGDDGKLTVLRNAGGGLFGLPPGSPFSAGVAGSGVEGVAAGDLSGDGRPDVVATVPTGLVTDGVAALLGDGTGNLIAAPGAPFTTRALAQRIAMADLDADHDLDVVTVSDQGMTNNQLAVLANDGLGGLTTIGAYGAPGTTNAVDLAVARLDGDARPDALVVSRNSGAGSAWAARGTSGNGFAPDLAPLPIGGTPAAVAAGDLDGDGDADGLVADAGAPRLHLLTNTGNAVLSPTVVAVPDAQQLSGLALSDLDGDGDLDAVVSDSGRNGVGWMLNDGTGDLDPPSWMTMGSGTRSPVVADLNGDAVPDLVTADSGNATVSVRLGTAGPVPEATGPGDFGSREPGSTGEPRSVTIANRGAALLRVRSVRLVGDAADDFLLTQDGCSGRDVRSGGAATCTVRLRFAPSATGARAAALRVEHAAGVFDVPLAGTGAEPEVPVQEPAPAAPLPVTAAPAPAPAAAAPAAATPTARPKAKAKAAAKLVLELLTRKVKAASGARATFRYSLGTDAHLTLRVKRGRNTVAILRGRRQDGTGTLRWTAKLGGRPAPKGAYRLVLRAVAADGRTATVTGALTLK